MRWRNFDEPLYDTIFDSSVSRIKEDKVEIIANDIDGPTVKKAIQNTRNAKVDDVVKCTEQSFFDLMPDRKTGVVILNPPYGERLPVAEIEGMYKEIGNKWIISSSPEAIKSIGLRPTRKIQIFNGSLECRYLKFELYSGSRKAVKNPDTMTKYNK
jgi:putative N6-adenine-specific DNA methylase